ncbi:MAG: hypothetical protein ABJC89_20095 [Acidobacteriota bacterium]
MLAGLDKIVELAGANTKIVPGQGEIVTKTAVSAHRDMLVGVRDKVAALVKAGPRRRWSAPYQIMYFNAFAGSDPAFVTSDSDFDWGEHGFALEQYFAAHPTPELYVLLSGTTRTCRLALPPVKALPNHPVSGWIAVSENAIRRNRGSGLQLNPCGNPASPGPRFNAPAGWLDWLRRREPVAIIGKTVRLYHVLEPPAENQ